MPHLPRSVTRGLGAGGLDVLRIAGPAATAEVFLHGAHVTAWAPVGQPPVLWMSPTSRFSAGSAIRGGVPLCLPWFGASDEPGAPAHGFARLVSWRLLDVDERGEDVVVTLALTDEDAGPQPSWPHAFEARYTVTVGPELRLALDVTNRGWQAVTVEEALHTYLAVEDVRRTTVSGLEGAAYLDRLRGPAMLPPERTPLRPTAETDRIYLATQDTVTVDDGRRRIIVAKTGSDATVVWNPWAEKAAALIDLDDSAWTGMLCVETANVRAAAVRLEPGQTHTMTATLRVEPRTSATPEDDVDPDQAVSAR